MTLIVYVSKPEYVEQPELIDEDTHERMSVFSQIGYHVLKELPPQTPEQIEALAEQDLKATGQTEPPFLAAPVLKLYRAQLVARQPEREAGA